MSAEESHRVSFVGICDINSDHFGLNLSVKLRVTRIPQKPSGKVRSWKNFDENSFVDQVSDVELIRLADLPDVNDAAVGVID
jgi:hypothetical protein